MKIYFIRHGEAQSNVNPLLALSPEQDGLTELGKKQTQSIISRFKNVPIDIIVTSSIERARQTALEIKKALGKPLVENSLFKERKGCFEIVWDYRNLSPRDLEKKMKEHSNYPEWKADFDESFIELSKRIEGARKMIEGLKEQHVLVVTHAMFLKAFIAFLVLEGNVSEGECVLFMKNLKIENSGITVCEFNPERSLWRLVTWNDQAHLV